MPIKDYSTDPDLNVSISGINIAEGCPPSGINNAIRQLMADVKVESEAVSEAVSETSSALEAFADQQAAKDEEQDEAIAEAKSSAEAAGQAAAEAQSTADAAAEEAAAANSAVSSLATVAKTGSYNDLSNKPSIPATPKAYITETWQSGTNWYRKYSDGWIEQGGVSPSKNYYSGDKKVTLHQAFKNTNYVALAVPNGLSANNSLYGAATIESTATSYFRIESDVNGKMSFKWYACGF